MGFLTVAYAVSVSVGQEAHFLPSEKKDKEKKEKKKGRKTSAKDPDSLIQKKKKKVVKPFGVSGPEVRPSPLQHLDQPGPCHLPSLEF